MKKYETYNKYLVRKPLFPYEILFDKEETKSIEDVVKELIKDDSFVTSIYWSSPDLYNTIINYRNNNLKEDKIPRLIHTLKKYAIRSSTRCTPYGTMAGVALQDIKRTGGETESSVSRKARIDMEFLAEIKNHIENNDRIKSKLKYKVNNTLDKIPGQFRYQEPITVNGEEKYQLSSLEINEYLEQISEIYTPVEYDEIKKLFSSDFESEEISEFINELINIKFLVSELQLTLTTSNLSNIKNVLSRLHEENVPDALQYLEIINKTEQCIKLIEETPVSYLPLSEITEIKSLAASLGIEKTHFFHVDLKHSSECSFELDEKTFRNIGTSISILQKFGTENATHKDLDLFKKHFHTKYESREIPLTEALDFEFGIGFPPRQQIGNIQGNGLIEGLAKENTPPKKNTGNSGIDLLLDLIEKGPKKIVNLESEDFKPEEDPMKAQNICVVGFPFDDEFFLQNIVNTGANHILGRFALLDEKIKTLCDEIYEKEQDIDPEAIFAEIIYIPEKRAANITKRPKFLDYEIPIFARSSNHEKQILLKDIMVSVQSGEIVLRSKKLNKRIIPKLSNAHNFYKSESPAYVFLCALQSYKKDNINLNINYSKTRKRYFPRIVYQNIILHRACWIMHESDINTIKKANSPILELKKFFDKWEVAKYIVLVQGDNELFLDTTNDTYLALLIDELKNNTFLQLSEWLRPGREGKQYNQQIVLPLENKASRKHYNLQEGYLHSIQRSFAPGSEWLYLKIYCNSNLSDSLLSYSLKPVLDKLTEENKVQKAFFIRYTDPHYHIRLRLHLADQKFYSEVLQKLYEVLDPHFQQEMIWNLQIDSYHRELERYHPEYMEAAEEAFGYDSILVLRLLEKEDFAENENVRLYAAVKNVDAWLSLFSLSLQEKLDFCKSMENVFQQEFSSDLKTHINSKYRILKEELHSFYTGNAFEWEYNERDQCLRKIKLHREALSSYIHMSINRWFSSEQRALELMTYSFSAKYYSRILSQSK